MNEPENPASTTEVEQGKSAAQGKPGSQPKAHKSKGTGNRSKLAAKKAPRSDTKQNRLIAMLNREDGATIEQMAKALNWQAHSIRGVISGLLKKKLGLKVVSKKTASGVLSYRIR